MTPRILMWVQSRLGLGHLSRTLVLGGALASDGFAVTIAHGGPPAPALRVPSGVDMVQLPIALAPDLNSSEITDAHGRLIDDAWKGDRIQAFKDLIDRLRPHIVMTETFPLGRRLFSFELLPILDWLHKITPRPLIVASARDVVTRPEKQSKADAMVELALRSYDLILCHSDPDVIKLSDSFPETSRLENMTRYSGYVTEGYSRPSGERSGVIIVAGGGAVGAALFEAAIQARPLWTREDGLWSIVTGPRYDQNALDRLRARAPSGIVIEGSVPGLSARYGDARLVVAQAGYNSVCEALSHGAKLAVVPYATAKETEQTIRADIFERFGLLATLKESDLSPIALAATMRRAIETPPQRKINFTGGATSARLLREALKGRAA